MPICLNKSMSNGLLQIEYIKQIVGDLFLKSYPEIKCAYLFGSYARGEATQKSDVDILVVLDKPMGMKYFGIPDDLEKLLGKAVDLHSYEQLVNNAPMIKDILVEGIKIYGQDKNSNKQ